jgi:hypothetical protein
LITNKSAHEVLVPPIDFIVQWAITWLILSVVFWVAAEAIQRYLYETAVDRIGWRVVTVTPLLAAALVGLPLPFDKLFFNFSHTIVHAALWFLACWLALRFQWQHAAAAGLIAVVTIAPVTSSSVESLMRKTASKLPAKTSTSPVVGVLSTEY